MSNRFLDIKVRASLNGCNDILLARPLVVVLSTPSFIATIADKDCPYLTRRVILHADSDSPDGMQFTPNGVAII
jgi:hypothetical protein